MPTKKPYNPSFKYVVCVEKFFTEQVNKVTVIAFIQKPFTVKIYYSMK